MNSKKINNTNEIPVMTLSEVFKTLVAVSHGDQEAPNWAGKKFTSVMMRKIIGKISSLKTSSCNLFRNLDYFLV